VIDGPRNNNKQDALAQKQIKDFIRNENIICEVIDRTTNLGCTANIILSVTEILKTHENVIVIEDDISIDPNFYEVMARAVKQFLGGGEIATICGYSPVSLNKFINKISKLLPENSWRSTKYFHCWGWATSRDFWDKFVEIDSKINIATYLENSQIWRNFSERKKQIWITRLNRRVWDYQVQTNLYKMDKLNLFPYFSLIYNEGQGRLDSTHTNQKKPWYMLKNVNHKTRSIKFSYKPSNLFWNFIDSETLAADGFFNSRGRKSGFRTILRKRFNRILIALKN
jgi:GR25 family glycosyltransferase involved in LPS biosynthesis